MRIFPCCRGGALLCFWLALALVVSFCYGDDDKTVEVVGNGECADCAQHSFDTKLAYSGLRVTIDCKTPGRQFKTRGSGELDEEGKFKVSLPNEILNKEGKLNEECYAQLHSSSDGPCPAHDGLESSKILSQTIKATTNDNNNDHDKHTFGLAKGKLKFSPITCASAFFWHHFHKKHPLCPPKTSDKPPQKPPLPTPAPKKELPSPVPKKKPDPPKEKGPKKEPCPPKANKPPKKEVPKKEPCPPKPEIKPLPAPTVPVYNKPPVPVYKPKHPFFKHPFYKHPFFKHLPPFPKFPYHPLFPKIPPFFDHPMFGKTPSTQNP
ncbi:proline-rich protein 4-like [Humulus lupulus]|uniref:proline-rich protein 4-like n=1 Tax=Humulus lupulus TaxID=3486 RepID=UPI002B411E48|nr:proline-rich protein 4-like [Humulus lupulus]